MTRSRGAGGEGCWRALPGGFQPHWENGKKQILSWDRANQNGPSALERDKQETQSCWRGPEGRKVAGQRGKGRLKTAAKPWPVIQPRSRQGQEDDAEGEKKVVMEKELRAQRSDKEQCVA